MSTPCIGNTKPDAGVIVPSPATAPEIIPRTDGFPRVHHSSTIQVKAPALAPRGTIQLNDVFVDERRVVYTVDRHVGGLYILEMDF